MTDVLKDFRVVVVTADGMLHTYSPEAFREAVCLAAYCPNTLPLSTCVARYNARMVREGINESARLVPARKR